MKPVPHRRRKTAPCPARRICPLLFSLIAPAALQLQSASAQPAHRADTLERTVQMDEVVVSGNKFPERKRNIVQKIDIVTARQIAAMNAQSTGDLLMGTGGVFVQKSQQGGGSPVIRGFEASRVLLVIDGIRMNNAIYRSGHLQNVITVDQNMLERVEILNGPSSTLYGSDALGGTIHLATRGVRLSKSPGRTLKEGGAFLRHSTANREATGHADLNLGWRRFGILTSVTVSDFDDLRMGGKDHRDFPGFGRRPLYVARVPGTFRDTVVRNDDDRIQRHSGYRQWDFLQKFLFTPSGRDAHSINLQRSGSTDIPRYDRLQDIRNNTLRFAEWYYGPQERSLMAYTFHRRDSTAFFREARLTLSRQGIGESRQTRELFRYDRFDSRRERLQVWGGVLDLRRVAGMHEVNTGADLQWNTLRSVADRTDLLTGTVTRIDTRYPDGGNRMAHAGIFAQHLLKMKGGKWVLNDGLRLQWTGLRSTIADNSFFQLPVTDMRQSNLALTGHAGLAWMPDRAHRLAAGIATGFRTPNIDDLAKIFESSTANRQLIIPNADISPERTYTADLNYALTVNGRIRLETAVYHTRFRNAITVAPSRLAGSDSVPYNGIMCRVMSPQNLNRAKLWGIQFSGIGDLGAHFSFQASLQATRGSFSTDPSSPSTVYERQADGSYALVRRNVASRPLDHIPPLFGRAGLRYRRERWDLECFSLFNGWKRLDRYNPDGEDNAAYATPLGTPGWYTLNLRGSVGIGKALRLQCALENILDRNYRHFASGFSAPGRNLVLAARATL